MLHLLIDATFLCHRAHHSTGSLSHEGQATGVAFGVLREVELLMDTHGPDRVVFAFDTGGWRHREQMDPRYKSSRRGRVLTDEEKEDARIFYEQVDKLKQELLPRMGFKNVFWQQGFEADDIIAAAVENLDTDDEAVIASADNDLWQLIRQGVCCYNPITKRVVTARSFYEEWGVHPSAWAEVKAMAGCSSDDVVGIRGVGEKTAAAWFAGTLKAGAKYDLIVANIGVYSQNIKLVRLPFPGTMIPSILPDEVTPAKKMEIMQELGIRDRRRPRAVQTKQEPGRPGGFDI